VFNSCLYLQAKPSTSTSSVRFRTVWAGTSGNKAESGLAHTWQTSREHLCQCSNFWALKQDSSSQVSLLIDLTRASFSVCPLYYGTIADCPKWDSKNSVPAVLPEVVEASWNVMAHALKPDCVFRRNGRVHLNRRGRQFSRLLAAEECGIRGSNAGYTMFRGSVRGTGYPFHPPVSPSLPLPCIIVCHHISTRV